MEPALPLLVLGLVLLTVADRVVLRCTDQHDGEPPFAGDLEAGRMVIPRTDGDI